jgi:hypothetical protein
LRFTDYGKNLVEFGIGAPIAGSNAAVAIKPALIEF